VRARGRPPHPAPCHSALLQHATARQPPACTGWHDCHSDQQLSLAMHAPWQPQAWRSRWMASATSCRCWRRGCSARSRARPSRAPTGACVRVLRARCGAEEGPPCLLPATHRHGPLCTVGAVEPLLQACAVPAIPPTLALPPTSMALHPPASQYTAGARCRRRSRASTAIRACRCPSTPTTSGCTRCAATPATGAACRWVGVVCGGAWGRSALCAWDVACDSLHVMGGHGGREGGLLESVA
jgi:hypothetical protein